MIEQAYQFGDSYDLSGILTSPKVIDAEQPMALILNAGAVHRIGPFRLHVDIARGLAAEGYASMRLDLSGLGDSPVRKNVAVDENRAILDAIDAFDFLQARTGCKKFVLIGLCSGANNAHHVALADERVVGSVFLDGIAYPTTEFYLRKYWKRLTSFRAWRNAIKRRFSENGQGDAQARPDESEFFRSEDKPIAQAAYEIQQLFHRGLQMLFCYTEGYDELTSQSQFRKLFGLQPDQEQLQFEYFENFEHTFPIAEHREALVHRVTSWFAHRFPSASVRPATAKSSTEPELLNA